MPPVLIRMGRPEEGFYVESKPRRLQLDEPRMKPIRNWIKMHGRLALVDGEGLFGSPSHTSERTRVHQRTVRALVIAWAPAGSPRSFVESVVEELSQTCVEHCGAKVAAAGIL